MKGGEDGSIIYGAWLKHATAFDHCSRVTKVDLGRTLHCELQARYNNTTAATLLLSIFVQGKAFAEHGMACGA